MEPQPGSAVLHLLLGQTLTVVIIEYPLHITSMIKADTQAKSTHAMHAFSMAPVT